MTADTIATAPIATSRITRSAAALTASGALTGGLGLVFWLAAAKLYTPAELGRDALLLAAMQTIAAAADLNLNSSLPRLVPQLGRRRVRFVGGSYAASAAMCVLATSAFVLLAPYLSPSFQFLREDGLLAFAVVASVAMWGVFALQDSVLVAVRRAFWVPVENTAFGIAKLGLVIVFGMAEVPYGIFFAWIIPAALLILPVNLLLVRSGLRALNGSAPLRLGGVVPSRTVMFTFLAYDYGGLLLQQAGILLLPVFVTSTLGSAHNAWFTIGFTCALAVVTVLLAVGNALMVEVADRPDQAVEIARMSARRMAFMLLPALTAAFIAAPLITGLFGSEYAEHATDTLRILLLATIPQALITLRIVLWRLDGKTDRILYAQLAVVGLLVIMLALMPRSWGLSGIAWSWFIAQAVVAVAMTRSLVSRLARKDPS